MVFLGVFKADCGAACKIIDFYGAAGVRSKFFTDFGLFGLRQDASVTPILYGFHWVLRHAGRSIGLYFANGGNDLAKARTTHGHLGELDGDLTGTAHNTRPDFDQAALNAGERPIGNFFW